jgi:transcriptional regulator with XRE-family HTH domain
MQPGTRKVTIVHIFCGHIESVAFRPHRLIGLRKAKGIRTQDELQAICGIDRTVLNKYEKGTKLPTAEALETIATSLDAEMGYFHGLGNYYEDNDEGFARAAVEMSFLAFGRDLKFSAHQKVRCGRTLSHRSAPRTLDGWRALAEMIDLAVSAPTPASKFGA